MTAELSMPKHSLYRRTVNKMKNVYALSTLYKLLNPGRIVEIYSISRYLPKGYAGNVLDIGCGDGFWTNFFGRRVNTITGIEPYKPDYFNAKKHASTNVKIFNEDAESMGFDEGSFDSVYSVCVFEHLYNDVAAFSQMHKVLKPGGQLLGTVDSLNAPFISEAFLQWHNKESYCNQLYTHENLKEKLESCGFTDVESRYLMGSKVSIYWEMFSEKAGIFSFIFAPIVYPVILALELNATNNYGYKMFVRAKKL